MTQPTLESFFSAGGGKSFSWKEKPVGTSAVGTIISVGDPQQQTDPVTKLPKTTRSGAPSMQVRIALQTTEKDPSDPEDDGVRNLFVSGWMVGAVGDALRKAGRQGPPEVGGWLAVTLSERVPNDNPALAPLNKFTAQYQSPAVQAQQQFFETPQPPAAPVAPPAPPAYVAPPAAPVAPPVAPPAAVAPPAPPVAPPAAAPAAEPPRPQEIGEVAWNGMDLATKIAVYNTFAAPGATDAAPF